MRVIVASDPPITFIVARARNGVIGRDGRIPWRLSTDMKAFKARSMGKPVLMGRKTWESLKAPLPGRDNLVLTRQTGLPAPGAWCFSAMGALVAAGRAMARAGGHSEVCVIGGAEIYSALLPIADRIVLTEVAGEVSGDAVMPPIDESAFTEIARSEFPAGPRDEFAFVIRELHRKK